MLLFEVDGRRLMMGSDNPGAAIFIAHSKAETFNAGHYPQSTEPRPAGHRPP
jgi:hypothetical protein